MVFLAAGAATPAVSDARTLGKTDLAPVADIVHEAVRAGQVPGAVVLVGNQDEVLYSRAFGHRALVPNKVLMTADTVFDLSSLTKVVATTTAVMQLVEKGSLRLDDPVAEYWPEFKANGKDRITVRELLTHYSGLRPDLEPGTAGSGYDAITRRIAAEKPIAAPGTRFIYSDINFAALGVLVRRLSKEPFDLYCSRHIFKPLGMKDTGFNPSQRLRRRAAPTERWAGKRGGVLRGEVHDPMARAMGGVAGHAGLFSTARDLSIFARALLGGGSWKGVRILSPLTVEKMTTPQTPVNSMAVRGLGWDIDSPFASNRGVLFPVGSYGHTGYTGTSIWIDPVSKVYVIVLASRLHPDGRGDAVPLRARIATCVAAALGPVSAAEVLASRRSLTGYYELMKGYRVQGMRNGSVQTGIDVLEAEGFASLAGLRVGLITNHSGLDSAGRRTVDLLHAAPGVKLMLIFSPEHGLFGTQDDAGAAGPAREPVTGLPVYSLYGEVYRPTEAMLDGLDALVFDVQDAGVRFYTYITTMAYAMEAAAGRGIGFYVLDRPNPLTGSLVQGPVMEDGLKSFTGYFPLPLRHGMTVGELAKLFNAENKIGARLHVVKMSGYERTDWYDETGLPWVKPSPNLRTLSEAVLYPGVAMVEGANVSVGRGTDTPFELLGAPWVESRRLSAYLNGRRIQGVRFMPVDFTPHASRFAETPCRGVQIILVDRQALDPAALGLEIAAALYRLYPGEFNIEATTSLVGAHWVLDAIKDGENVDAIVERWQTRLEEFRKLRSKYLLY